MKKALLITIAIFSLYCISCKKKPQYKIEYLELYNKPLNEIRSTLNGKWQVHKKQGGFTGFDILYPKNTFIEFKFGNININDSVRHYNDTIELANNKATWNKEYAITGDSTYMLHYIDKYIFSQSKIILHIKNDSLVISDNFINGYSSLCTKVN